jgi:hypothetical protein
LKEVLPPHPLFKNFKTKVKKDTALSKGVVSFLKFLEGGRAKLEQSSYESLIK